MARDAVTQNIGVGHFDKTRKSQCKTSHGKAHQSPEISELMVRRVWNKCRSLVNATIMLKHAVAEDFFQILKRE